jgi:MFS family permease
MAVPFYLFYLLQELQMPLWQTVVVWSAIGIGTSVASPAAGRIVDRHGHRPVLIIAAYGKPIIALLFALVGPRSAFPVLLVWSFVDGVLNAGLLVATNGYMLTISPQRNRSMFVATITGLSGLAGGLAGLLTGKGLDMISEFRADLFGREWNHFQLMFFVCFLLRCAVIPFAFKVQEVKSTRTMALLHEFRGILPLQALRYPIGLYRKLPAPVQDGVRRVRKSIRDVQNPPAKRHDSG